MSRLLVINVVGLTPGEIGPNTPAIARFVETHGVRTLHPPLPAVTATSQATIMTGALPSEHGIVSNGWYFRDTGEVRFWLRSNHLVGGESIWDAARGRRPDFKTALLFWRYCTHASCDITVTERPTYWADGRKGPDIYTEPAGLHDELGEKLGDFPLFRFWGPATNIESTRWIAEATAHVLSSSRPDLVLTYLPHLDYDVQKFGPGSAESDQAHREIDLETGRLIEVAAAEGYDVALVSEYGITAVERPVFLNRVLREEGLVRVQAARNGELLEPGASRAFAACSHQVAHVYVADPADIDRVSRILEQTEGVESVLKGEELRSIGLNHARSGELVAVADERSWFAYPYWLDDQNAPDFAHCVAIHDKPGHDPAEMFLGPGGKRRVIWRMLQKACGIRAPFDVISLDATTIRGSHGRPVSDEREGPVLATSWPIERDGALAMTDLKQLFLDRLK